MFQVVALQPVFLKAQDEVNPNDVAQAIEKMKGPRGGKKWVRWQKALWISENP